MLIIFTHSSHHSLKSNSDLKLFGVVFQVFGCDLEQNMPNSSVLLSVLNSECLLIDRKKYNMSLVTLKKFRIYRVAL